MVVVGDIFVVVLVGVDVEVVVVIVVVVVACAAHWSAIKFRRRDVPLAQSSFIFRIIF